MPKHTEVAMNDTFPTRTAKVPRPNSRLDILRCLVATWDDRIRFRRELGHKAKANPHLIDDIGLTKRQVETEIAKPFWKR